MCMCHSDYDAKIEKLAIKLKILSLDDKIYWHTCREDYMQYLRCWWYSKNLYEVTIKIAMTCPLSETMSKK